MNERIDVKPLLKAVGNYPAVRSLSTTSCCEFCTFEVFEKLQQTDTTIVLDSHLLDQFYDPAKLHEKEAINFEFEQSGLFQMPQGGKIVKEDCFSSMMVIEFDVSWKVLQNCQYRAYLTCARKLIGIIRKVAALLLPVLSVELASVLGRMDNMYNRISEWALSGFSNGSSGSLIALFYPETGSAKILPIFSLLVDSFISQPILSSTECLFSFELVSRILLW
ncbi:hypothetical protein T05_16315 [Trichinella murrelli]|uniref:Uncharacterized protein n=1 Tax=Trichinella murrelli TaxID=144512 RepID=A0A0V0U5F3_9BILA|nr:hypothetical protein T05_16315 [Trichinella murrelli]